MEHIERTHPLRVTLGQIVVHCYYVNTITGQCVQEYWQGSHKRLTFTSCHLGNLTLMQNNTTKQLYVVVYHFPLEVVASCSPVIMIDGFITIDGDEVLLWVAGQFTVEVSSCNYGLLVFSKTACCFLYNGKNLWHYLVECLLVDIQYFLLDLVDLSEDIGTLVDRCILDSCL